MTASSTPKPDHTAAALAEIPDRNCTWCKVPMAKRLVGGGAYIHYTCPKCVFQHTSKREKKT
jgi:phage FluMu protein Com